MYHNDLQSMNYKSSKELTQHLGIDNRQALNKYWQTGDWIGANPNQIWRDHADWIHARLLHRLLIDAGAGACRYESVLKTDLYEEAVGKGQIGALSERVERVIGIDLSAPIVKTAKGTIVDLQGVVADTRALPFPDESFDLVVSFSTLDHFVEYEDILKSLKEIGRVIRPGGKLLITLDNLANPIVKLRQAMPFELLNRINLVPYYCGQSIHPKKFQQVFEDVSLTVDSLTSVMHCPRVFAIPVARVLGTSAPHGLGVIFSRFLRAFEVLESLPSRYRTGYFVAACCRKDQ